MEKEEKEGFKHKSFSNIEQEAKHPVPQNDIETIFKQCGRSIMMVKTIHNIQGTAAFYIFEAQGLSHHFCLVTCYHVFDTVQIEEICRAQFQFDSETPPFRLNSEWIAFITFNLELDVVIIEIKKEIALEFFRAGTNFIFPHAATQKDKVTA